MRTETRHFRHIKVCDTEYIPVRGEMPVPVSLCWLDARAPESRGACWLHEGGPVESPFDADDTLLIAFNAPSELTFMAAMGWRLPAGVIDLMVEQRNITNGDPRHPRFPSLYKAMDAYRLPHASDDDKDANRDMILRGVYDDETRRRILDYNMDDVIDTYRLWEAMRPRLNIGQALWRGRYLRAMTAVHANGIPVDTSLLDAISGHKFDILRHVVSRVNNDVPVFDDTSLQLSTRRFGEWLDREGLAWPRTEKTGAPRTDDETLHDREWAHPALPKVRDTIKMSRTFRGNNEFPIGRDGRARLEWWSFGTVTSRNKPLARDLPLLGPKWQRAAILAPPGYTLVDADYRSQEPALAAALSGDAAMAADYSSGDLYLNFGMRAGLVPDGATKESHPAMRKKCKIACLSQLYGTGVNGLAAQLGGSIQEAASLLRSHREVYRRYHEWQEANINHDLLGGPMSTCFGWCRTVHGDRTSSGKPIANSLRNWRVQAHGAEMLRAAVTRLVEAGVEVIAPMHDSVLVLAPDDQVGDVMDMVNALMRQASRDVTPDMEVDIEMEHYPGRYIPGDNEMWNEIRGLMTSREWWREVPTYGGIRHTRAG